MVLSVIAFHEKAGRSQVNSFVFLLDKGFSRAEWPLSPCFHSHSRGAIRSLGASWAFSLQPVLPSVYRPGVPLLESGTRARRLTQSPELGLGFCLSLPGTVLGCFCSFVFTRLRPLSLGCCCATERTLLRSPTGDAATPPAFSRSQRGLASSRFFRHAPPASVPSA